MKHLTLAALALVLLVATPALARGHRRGHTFHHRSAHHAYHHRSVAASYDSGDHPYGDTSGSRIAGHHVAHKKAKHHK